MTKEPTQRDPVDRFLDRVLAWLVARQDPRAVRVGDRYRIDDLVGASADFCAFMAKTTEEATNS